MGEFESSAELSDEGSLLRRILMSSNFLRKVPSEESMPFAKRPSPKERQDCFMIESETMLIKY